MKVRYQYSIKYIFFKNYKKLDILHTTGRSLLKLGRHRIYGNLVYKLTATINYFNYKTNISEAR